MRPTRKLRGALALVVGLSLAAAACSDDGDSNAGADEPAPVESPAPDAAGLGPVLEGTNFREGTAPIVANTDALGHTDPHCWPDQLTRHLVAPVRWRESQRTLAASGGTTFIEVGPGRVLAGLARRTVPDVTVLNVSTPDDLSNLLATNTLAGATR